MRFVKFDLTHRDALYPVAVARDAVVRVDPIAGHEEHPTVPPTCQITLINETNLSVKGRIDEVMAMLDPASK